MSSFDDLPRDVIKKIVSKMDIDTKVRLSLIFKLKVPSQIIDEISKCLQVPTTYDGVDELWFIKLGPRVCSEYTTYMLQRFTANGLMVYLTTHAIMGVGTTNYSTQDVEGEYDEH
jgi:hypothetical protein